MGQPINRQHSDSPDSRGTTDRWWFWLQNALSIAALFAPPLTAGNWLPLFQFGSGALFFVAGAIIGVLGVRALGANRTPHPAPLPDGKLVQGGIYSRIRHPLYSSLILLTFGWSVLWASLPGLLISAALAILLDRKAVLEERYLAERFPEYTAYAKRVPRWYPPFINIYSEH